MALVVTDLNGSSEMLTDYKDLTRKRRVNGERSLSFLLLETDRNTHSYPLVLEESTVEYDNETYRIKKIEQRSLGNKSVKSVQADHVFFDLIDTYQYTEISGTKTLAQALDFALTGTGWTYAIIDSFATKEFESLGDDNALALLQKIINTFDAEFTISGTQIQLYSQIGSVTDFQFRFKHNLKTISKSVDTANLSTYIKGYGKQNEDGTYVVEAEYTSPNSAIYGIRHAKPVYDDRYTVQSSLLERLQKEIQDEPEISFAIEFVELQKAGFPFSNPNLGDTIFVIYEPLGIDITARIIEYIEYPEEPKSATVTLANFKNNLIDILANFGRIEKTVNRVVDDSGKVRYNVLDEAVKRATEALNNSMTELEYPVGQGILARDPNNSNNLVVLKSNGIGISTDGGTTYKEAITSQGFVLSAGAIGQLEANNIKIGVGTTYESGYNPTTKVAVSNGNEIDMATYTIKKDSNFYWDATGFYAVDPLNANNVVRITSGGVGLSEDGGTTFVTSLTASGLIADKIVGNKYVVGRGATVETLELFTADNTSHYIKSTGTNGFRVEGAKNLSLQAGVGYKILALKTLDVTGDIIASGGVQAGTASNSRFDIVTLDGTLTVSSTGALKDYNNVFYAKENWVTNNFSASGHNHDATYLKLTGGTLTGGLVANSLQTVSGGNIDISGKILVSGVVDAGSTTAYFRAKDATNCYLRVGTGSAAIYVDGTAKASWTSLPKVRIDPSGDGIVDDKSFAVNNPGSMQPLLMDYIPVNASGETIVSLDENFFNFVGSYDVFLTGGEVIRKESDHFIVNANGAITCLVMGIQRGKEDVCGYEITNESPTPGKREDFDKRQRKSKRVK